MISPPPVELIASAWLPYIIALFQRANLLLRLEPRLVPTSWWRSVSANIAAGGSDESQHLFALAFDADGPEDALRRALALAPGLGLVPVAEPGYDHFQLFPRGALARIGVVFPR